MSTKALTLKVRAFIFLKKYCSISLNSCKWISYYCFRKGAVPNQKQEKGRNPMSITTENTVIETAIGEIIDAALHMNLRSFEVDGGEVIIRHQGAGYSVRPVVASRVAVRPDGLPVSILGMGPRSDVVVYEVRGPQHDETGDWVELRTPHRAMLYIAGLM